MEGGTVVAAVGIAAVAVVVVVSAGLEVDNRRRDGERGEESKCGDEREAHGGRVCETVTRTCDCESASAGRDRRGSRGEAFIAKLEWVKGRVQSVRLRALYQVTQTSLGRGNVVKVSGDKTGSTNCA